MNPVDRFLEYVRRDAPARTQLINSRAALLREQPAALLDDFVGQQVLERHRLYQLWGDALGVAYVNPMTVAVPTDPGVQLPVEVARHAQAVVVSALGEAATVAMAEPDNTRQVGSLAKILGKAVSPVFAHPEEIRAVIDLYLGERGNIVANLQSVYGEHPALAGAREITGSDDVAGLVEARAIIELLNSIILTAYRRRASDIHFEPRAEGSRVRMRIDGDMETILELPLAVHQTLLARLKVLCRLDISEARLPQDGAFELHFGPLDASFRVATVPTIHGEKAVLRVLGSPLNQSLLNIEMLGFARSTLDAIKRVISRPSGILIVCGPTGSGKTTTLYACVQHLNRPDLNITTIEDPVEYRLADITQHQINSSIGLTFQKVLRSVMRQDPDVILIGEIRDLESALIATEAALTGHFVLTTLHTTSALQAVTRLVEIGVEPYLVAPTTMGVLSQRLVRRICPACKEAYQPADAELAPHFTHFEHMPISLYRGRGCPKCYGTGYSGRVALYEFIEVSERMRELIVQKAAVSLLLEEAARVGHRSLRYDGLMKALVGWTTLEEVERNTPPDVSYEPVAGP